MRADVPQEVRDSLWLQLRRGGLAVAELARLAGVSLRTVQLAISRAAAREASPTPPSARRPSPLPPLVPLFPIQPFTPQSTCPHHGPLRPGTWFCCMVCSRSGMDSHPDLRRDERTDPKPEPRPPATPPRETRRQRRARSATRPAA